MNAKTLWHNHTLKPWWNNMQSLERNQDNIMWRDMWKRAEQKSKCVLTMSSYITPWDRGRHRSYFTSSNLCNQIVLVPTMCMYIVFMLKLYRKMIVFLQILSCTRRSKYINVTKLRNTTHISPILIENLIWLFSTQQDLNGHCCTSTQKIGHIWKNILKVFDSM